MTIFRLPRFLRRFLRRHMTPMTEESAWSTKDKLAIAYAFIAWNAAGLALYQIFGKGNVHWPVSRGIKDPEEEMIRPGKSFTLTIPLLGPSPMFSSIFSNSICTSSRSPEGECLHSVRTQCFG